MKKNDTTLNIYKYFLLLFPKQFRKQYSSEILLLISEEYKIKIREKKVIQFWVWLISDYLISLINFYITEGTPMRENKYIKLTAKILILFGFYNLLLVGLRYLHDSPFSLTPEVRRIIGIIPWYADFFVYIMFFIGMLGLVIFFNNKNLPVLVIFCVLILMAASFKIINTFSVMFSGPVPKISNFGLYFISIGMLFIGIILLWKKHISFFQFIPYLLIGIPLLSLISPINEFLSTISVLRFSSLFFGIGWIMIGRELMKWIDDDIHLTANSVTSA